MYLYPCPCRGSRMRFNLSFEISPENQPRPEMMPQPCERQMQEQQYGHHEVGQNSCQQHQETPPQRVCQHQAEPRTPAHALHYPSAENPLVYGHGPCQPAPQQQQQEWQPQPTSCCSHCHSVPAQPEASPPPYYTTPSGGHHGANYNEFGPGGNSYHPSHIHAPYAQEFLAHCRTGAAPPSAPQHQQQQTVEQPPEPVPAPTPTPAPAQTCLEQEEVVPQTETCPPPPAEPLLPADTKPVNTRELLNHLSFKDKQLVMSALRKTSANMNCLTLLQERERQGRVARRDFQVAMDKAGLLNGLSSREVEAVFKGFPADPAEAQLDFNKFSVACKHILSAPKI